MTFWLLHAGRDGEYEEYMLKNNVIAIGYHDFPNLSKIKDMDELKEIYRQAYGEKEKPARMRIRVSAIWSFCTKMKKGDLVASPLKKKSEIIIGEIIGEYTYQNPESPVRHTRKVNWLKTFPRSSFETDIQNSFGAQLTVSQVRADNAEERIRGMLNDRFAWTGFYSEFADKLLQYKDNRRPLIEEIHRIYKTFGWTSLTDKFKDGTRGPVKDIDPFTVFSLFNRGLTISNRKRIAGRLAKFLGIGTPAPDTFDAIPIMFNLAYWIMPFANKRATGHIDALWGVFADALEFAGNKDGSARDTFVESLNNAIDYGSPVKKITIGLYWIRPYRFLPLDSLTRKFLEEQMRVSVPKEIRAEEYLDLQKKIESMLKAKDAAVHSFPELSYAAYSQTDNRDDDTADSQDIETKSHKQTYSVSDIVDDGCFVGESELESIMNMLEGKKNIILQGPPGTGKTFLAKRMAYALAGSKSGKHVRVFQFHPNLSYEDFVRGWRPGGNSDGRLALADGPFLKLIEDAQGEPEHKFVMVIEEINRGNPANIFGEMLTLLEADKRKSEEALNLSYMRDDDEPVYIPENMYVIGTMNVADRSIALVDLALRRRFGFYDLIPVFDKAWKNWVHKQCGIDMGILNIIGEHMEDLNKTIEKDELLGPHFQVGHSYVTPNGIVGDPKKWFSQVVKSEIGPLLAEYWVEEPDRAQEATYKLLEGLDSWADTR